MPRLRVTSSKLPAPRFRNRGKSSRASAVSKTSGRPSPSTSRASAPMPEIGRPYSVTARPAMTLVSSKVPSPRFMNSRAGSVSFATKKSVQPSSSKSATPMPMPLARCLRMPDATETSLKVPSWLLR